MASKWLETHPQSINKLIERIRNGDIKIPAFQREFVWDQNQILHLLDSINRGYPIGSVLLWLTDERLTATRDIGGFRLPDTLEKYPVNYVLDGQQRITSVFASLTLENHQPDSIFDIYYDIANNSFLPSRDDCEQPFPVNVLFDTIAFLREIQKLENPKEQELVAELQTRFKEYDIPVITITGQEHEQVCIIFERINNSGTGLTMYELMSAWTWSNSFDLREKFQEILIELEEKGFGDLNHDVILRIISGILSRNTSTKTILGLKPETIRIHIDRIKQAIFLAIDYLATELKIASLDFLPAPMQLVPLAVFFDQQKTATAQQNRMIKKWFWKCSFSNRYSKATELNVEQDIGDMLSLCRNELDDVFKFKPNINYSIFSTRKFQKSAVITKAFIVLLAQREPKDLLNGQNIDIGKALSSYNYKEFHHIFPQAFLKKNGFDNSKISVLANYCFLSSKINKEISDSSPSDYFELIPKDERELILNSSLIPYDNYIIEDNYEEFLIARAQYLYQYLETMMN